MKRRLLFFLVLCSTSIFSQDASSEKIIENLKLKIEKSTNGEKLHWMDSLSNYSFFTTRKDEEAILIETIAYASELDSVNILIEHTGNLINYYNNRKGVPKKGNKRFIESLIGLSSEEVRPRLLAKLYIEGGDSYYFLEDHETAITNYRIAESYAEKANDIRLIGVAKIYMGGSQSFLGKFSEASQALQEASKIFQEAKDTFNIISARNSLSILYSQNEFFDEAKTERDEAILLAEKIKSYGHLSSFYYNAATDARKQGNNAARIENLKAAFDSSRKTNNPKFYEVTMLTAFVIAYSQMDSIALASSYLAEIEKNSATDLEGRNREPYVDALKNFAFAKKEYAKALQFGKEHLAIQKAGTHYEEIKYAEKFMADVYVAIDDKGAAYSHFRNYNAIKDSISSVQKIKALSFYQTLYETEKRDLKIKAQKSDIALLDARNSVKNQLLFFGSLGLLSVFGGILLMRSRNVARHRQKMQEGFSQDLINAQEEERTRLARELHDSVGQKLMLLTKQTKSAGNVEMDSLAANTLEELRSISRGLHPATLEKLGITAAIKSLINEVDANTNIFFTNEIDDIDNLLSQESSLHLYRILQEVLNNMVKHAEAKAASITIARKKNTIEATIKDNGNGFELSEKLKLGTSLGMKTLLERANIIKSTLEIKSKRNEGTTIELVIPT